MDNTSLKNYNEKYTHLAEILSRSKYVTRYDSNEEKEGWTLSHSFLDLEESFRNFIDTLLPQLLNDKINEEQIDELLLSVGEEFRHILYHIYNTRYYDYLFPLEKAP